MTLPDTLLETPLFICGHRKGGTTVVLCLFDNHPQLLTYPADSGFFYMVFPACQNLTKEETVELVAQKVIEENLTTEMKVVGDPDVYNPTAIADRYRQIVTNLGHTPADHLTSLIQAYGELCGQEQGQWIRWVEKTTSTEIYAQEISNWFPKAKFLHIVRDPRDNYASLKSGWRDRYQHQEGTPHDLLQTMLDRGGLGLRMARLNQTALGKERYLVIKYEDLTSDPEKMLNKICNFVGIAYSPALETPTVNGRLWAGNNFDGLKFNALSNVNVGRWAERVEEEETALIEGQLADPMEQLGYEFTTTPAQRAAAIGEHYKWFNFLQTKSRG
jgi:hypothetical protein